MVKHVPITSNQQFLELLFGADWERATVCSVPVLGGPRWTAHRARDTLRHFDPKHNNYFAVSLFSRPTERQREFFETLCVLVLDDVGPKTEPDKVTALLGEPIYRLETSPGNFQWGYRLAPRIDDASNAGALINHMIETLYAGKDPGMAGVTRLVRLPFGTNTKSHLGVQGFAGRLTVTEPMPGPLDPASIMTMAPVPAPGAASGSASRTAGTAGTVGTARAWPRAVDPVVDALGMLGLMRSANPHKAAGGWGWDIVCPWSHEHTPTGAVNTGTMYFRGGGFKCWHGHCDQKGPADVRARIDEMLKDDSGGLVGLDDLDPNKFDVVDPNSVPASPVPPEASIVTRFWRETVYHATENRFLTLRNDTARLNDQAFDTAWISALRGNLPRDAKTDKPITPSQWYRGGDRKQIVEGRTWRPGQVRLFTDKSQDKETRFLNTWRTPHRPLENTTMPTTMLTSTNNSGIRDWYRLQELLFDAGTPEGAVNFEHWLDYQSMIIARVDIKPGHNPLLIGPQGAGKEIMLRPLLDVLGPDRYRQIDQDTLKGGFTDWVMNRLVILPEVHRPSRWNVTGHDEYTRIKAFCDPGKPFIPVNEKYQGIIQARNVFVLIMTSNEEKPLALPADDRRVWVVRVKETGWPVARFQALARAFGEPTPFGATNSNAIVEWLIRRYEHKTDVEKQAMVDAFTGHAPITRDKEALIEQSRSEPEVWIEELLARKLPDPLTVPDVFTAQDVMERVENAASVGGYGLARGTEVRGGAGAIGRILRKLGCVALNKEQGVLLPGGIERRVWVRPGDVVYSMMSERELKDWLDANRRA